MYRESSIMDGENADRRGTLNTDTKKRVYEILEYRTSEKPLWLRTEVQSCLGARFLDDGEGVRCGDFYIFGSLATR